MTISLETIDVGTLPNDGTGDPLRVAYEKINNNFALLSYTTANLTNATTTGNTTQTILQFPANAFSQGTFQITSSHPGNGNASQSITLTAFLTNDPTVLKFTGIGAMIDGSPITTYDVNISSGNVRVQVTPLISANISHFISSQITFTGDAP
jgi:hypothetical protein